MNTRRWIAASIAVAVVLFGLEFLLHQVLLQDIYQQTASVWRPQGEIMQKMWLFWAGYLVFAPLFAFVYVKGYEPGKNGLGQGLRYGFYLGVMVALPMNLGWYAVLPIPATLAVYWIVGGIIEFVAAGAAAGLVYKP